MPTLSAVRSDGRSNSASKKSRTCKPRIAGRADVAGPAADDGAAEPLARTQDDREDPLERRQRTNTHSYLSPKCEVRLTNDRGGRTVVAREAIAKGEPIVVWSGTLVDGAQLKGLSATARRYSLQVEEDHYLVSLTDCEPADFVNHSCNPNAGLSGQIALVAMRDIAPGEEVSYDYAMSDGSSYDEFDCGCGSANCRGRVTGDDWKLPELWHRYAGHFSPYLQRRILRLRRRLAAKTSTTVLAKLPAAKAVRVV